MGMGRGGKGRTDRQIDRGISKQKGKKRIWTSSAASVASQIQQSVVTDSDYQFGLVSVFSSHIFKLVFFHESMFYIYHWAYGMYNQSLSCEIPVTSMV